MLIRPVENKDRPAVFKIIHGWGSDIVVTRGKIHHPIDLPGFVALDDNNQVVGLITYTITGQDETVGVGEVGQTGASAAHDRECEVVTLDALTPGLGIGTKLLDAVVQKAKSAGCRRLWFITTNDNLEAIQFYEHRGFKLKAVHANAIAESRKLKPQIPLIGNHGIPIRDEIEFEMIL